MSDYKVSTTLLFLLLLLLETFAASIDWDTFPAYTIPPDCESPSCYRFYNNDTAPYFVESWPLVPKRVHPGEFYAGSIPIDESDPSRTLFFIFKPAIDAPTNDVTIWLNGGPGCSSLIGFFQENGPFTWKPGTLAPYRNPYTWARVTNMLWVDQPVGAGFSNGKKTAHNEIGISKDFVGFFKNWEKLFGIENYKIYVTGESYAGRYVPYIAAEMLNQNDKTYFDVGGALVYDPGIGSYIMQGMEIPTYSFVKANNVILNVNQSFLNELEAVSSECGYTQWMEKYLTFPPPGNQPQMSPNAPTAKCDIAAMAYGAIYNANPCFNVYHITDYCPYLVDRLLYEPPYKYQPYFNRTDVKEALHVTPIGGALKDWWVECSFFGVFDVNGPGKGPEDNYDRSPDPIQGVLPQVIEGTNRVIISNGNYDSLLKTQGTLLSIQNMTWNGELGFQEAPSKDFVVPIPEPHHFDGPQGVMGKQHYERGLMWVESYQAGHQQPQYQPRQP